MNASNTPDTPDTPDAPDTSPNVPEEQRDQLIIRHPDSTVAKEVISDEVGTEITIGRELDNQVALVDPRSSRHHAKIRRVADDLLEISDIGSANGTLLGSVRLDSNDWHPLRPGQVVHIGDTQISWEQSVSSQATVGMAPITDAPPKPAAAAPAPAQGSRNFFPWIVGALGALALIAFLIWLLSGFNQSSGPIDSDSASVNPGIDISQQTPQVDEESDSEAGVVDENATPLPLVPAIPTMRLERIEYLPVISGALFDPQHVYAIIQVRVENLGDEPFIVSSNKFYAETTDGVRLNEFGQQFAPTEFQRLGVISRFENLSLGSGGSVAEELVFYLETKSYEASLFFQPDGMDPVAIELPPLEAGRELAILLGTPVAEPTEELVSIESADLDGEHDEDEGDNEASDVLAESESGDDTDSEADDIDDETASLEDSETDDETVAEAETAEADENGEADETEEDTEEDVETEEPTPTPAPQRADGVARTIPTGSLVGTIAFPDFNGETYDIYFGDVASGEKALWRSASSQPAFSNSGDRIAYHSWAEGSRGLITSNLDHSNGFLVGTFIEDQLPTWSPDDGQIMFLSRRTGSRQSQLYLVPSSVERPEAQLQLEGEFPSWHPNGRTVFKGWVTTGIGLRITTDSTLTDFESLTDNDQDTSPSISPDGSTVVFMSRRDDNWDIYSIGVDGSNLTRLTTDASDDGVPTWSPDGQAIAFMSNRGGPWAVWAMTPNGTGIRQLFTLNGSADGFVASEPTTDTTRGWAEERISWTN